MKLSHLTAMTALATAAAAQAQTPSVTLYGLLDVGVEYIGNVEPGGHNWRMPLTTGTFPSRWGVRGTEPLGNGIGAVYTLEMGFSPGTGSLGQGGRAFGRQAFVGLSTPYGTVSLGRQYSMLYWSMINADILGPNVYGLGTFDAYVPNSRIDNSLAWRGTFGSLTLGATYSLGRDTVNAGPSPVGANCPPVPGDSQACRQWSVMAKYDTAAWGAAAAYDRIHGRSLGAAPDAVFGGLDSRDKTDSRLSLNGYVVLGSTKVGAGLIRRDNDGNAARPKSTLWYLGAAYPLTPALTIDGAVQSLKYKNVEGFDSTLLAVRATYAFSKRTSIYGQVARMDNDSSATLPVSGGAPGSTPPAGGGQNGLNVGIRHSF